MSSDRFTRTQVSSAKKACADLGIRPRKQWGQNFLIDAKARDRVIDAASLTSEHRVLEVGPGLGALTEVLLDRVSALVAIERDQALWGHLSGAFDSVAGLDLRLGDALKIDFEALDSFDRCVSNLPYSCGTRILVNWIHSRQRPQGIVVTIQREVAQRIRATPGTGDYGPLAIWAQLHYDVKIAAQLSPSSFWPQPDVHSSIVCMQRLPVVRCAVSDLDFFYRLTREAFRYRRKQLGTVLLHLSSGLVPADAGERIQALGLDATRRPEAFTIEEWVAISDSIAPSVAQADPRAQ